LDDADIARHVRCCILSLMLALKGALADVIEVSRQAVTLGELAQGALDGLRRAFDCTLGCFTHSPQDGAIEILSGTDASVLKEYHRDWFAADPINGAIRSYDASWIIPASRLPEWPTMQKHPLYAEWAPSKDVHFLLHLRLNQARYLQTGATNVFLCRSKHGHDFGHREVLALSQVLPELEMAVRRCERVAAMNALGPFLESLLAHTDSCARLAMRADGQLIWVSKAARRMLADHLGHGRSLPGILIETARRIAGGTVDAPELQLVTANAARFTATLQPVQASTGELFVVITLHSLSGALPDEFRTQFRLTVAEADVLSDLAEGLSNAQIAERRLVSISTARTHVARVLSKLGVRSRLQAGVLACRHGVGGGGDPDDDRATVRLPSRAPYP
jgi:DNA-binding NarL/FixJ family response regulator